MPSTPAQQNPFLATLRTVASMRVAVDHLGDKLKSSEDYARIKTIYNNIQTLKAGGIPESDEG
jgi:hypothetical protein